MAILIEGRNCWRIADAGRVAFLIDGADYFAAFAAAASRAPGGGRGPWRLTRQKEPPKRLRRDSIKISSTTGMRSIFRDGSSVPGFSLR